MANKQKIMGKKPKQRIHINANWPKSNASHSNVNVQCGRHWQWIFARHESVHAFMPLAARRTQPTTIKLKSSVILYGTQV